MKKTLLFFVLNSLLGTLVYFAVLYLTFPSDTARDRIVYEANKAGYKLQLVSVKPTWPWGFTLEGVDFYGVDDAAAAAARRAKAKRAKAKDLDKAADTSTENGTDKNAEKLSLEVVTPIPLPPLPGSESAATPAGKDAGNKDGKSAEAKPEPADAPLLTLDSVSVTSLLGAALSQGKIIEGVDFAAELYGGDVSGTYGQADGLTSLKLNASGLDLGRYPFQTDSFDLKLSGIFGMDCDLSLQKDKIRESEGAVSFKFENLHLAKGSKIKGFDLPFETTFTVTGTQTEVKNGRIEFQELKLESAPLTITVTGSIMLNASLMRSRANLKVMLKFGDELKLVAAFLPESAKGPDGTAHYVLSGPLNNLKPRPDRIAARKGGRDTGGIPRPGYGGEDGASRPMPGRPPIPGLPNIPGMPPMPGMNDDGPNAFRAPVLDDEERERLREERRKRAEERRKRREELRQRRLELGNNPDRPGFTGGPGELPGSVPSIEEVPDAPPDFPIPENDGDFMIDPE